MKNIKIRLIISLAIILTAIAVPVTQTGCASANRTAHQAVGVTQITVDSAMHAWGAYVSTGKPSVAQEVAVKAAFEQYQLAAVTVIDAAKAAGANAKSPILNQAVAAASASLTNLVNLIKSFGVKI